MSILDNLSSSLQAGNVDEVTKLVNQGLEDGLEPRAILYDGLMDGMGVIGEKFKKNEVFVPEVLIAARAMNAGMKILKPKLIETGVEDIGKAVIGTVKGDLHDIGKNLVKMMLEGNGFEVIDLGTDVSPQDFADAVVEHKPDIIGLSALLTTTKPVMEEIVEKLEAEALRDKVIVMVGGAPISDKYCTDIGADFYAKDAATAASIAKEHVMKVS
jgi:5-methyltetrahydrofolate--homocysteine methyltransferase